MKPSYFLKTLLVGLLMWTGTRLDAQVEQDLIATLQSGAGAPQKWAACQKLRVIGTAKAVPALAALLPQEGLSQAARYVLEALPGPAADTALREALAQTSGLLKAGVIDSLGWRGKEQAVPLLAPLLLNSDTNIAAAASSALGRIGGREAIAALSASRSQVAIAVQPTLLESLLKCAERLAASNDAAGALAIYHGLFTSNDPVPIRAAAWRDLVLADSEHRAELIINALQGADRPVQIVALKLLRELNDKGVVQACAAQWPSLTPEPQLAVLDAEVKLGAEALPLVHLASQSADLRVRVAAWQALGELNDTTSIPALARATVQGEPAEREAAIESLERLHGPDASQVLISQLDRSSTPEKAELLRILGERGDRAAANILLQNAASDAGLMRQAALAALGRLAAPETAAPLLAMATRAKSDDDRGQLLAALYSVIEANPDKEQPSRALVPMLERLPARGAAFTPAIVGPPWNRRRSGSGPSGQSRFRRRAGQGWRARARPMAQCRADGRFAGTRSYGHGLHPANVGFAGGNPGRRPGTGSSKTPGFAEAGNGGKPARGGKEASAWPPGSGLDARCG